jgi:4-diphosphocytidyl-2-C-methyl-D-erythritol kinase
MITAAAPAKVNLHLRILRRREDGFHELHTRMVRVSIADELCFRTLDSGDSRLTCSDAELACDESNLILRALRSFQAASGIVQPWHIHVEKRIPMGAGLGGGSSDAATVLKTLNEAHGQPLTLEQLAELGSALGSDVPFFLYEKVCDASGRGEQVTPVDWPWKLRLLMIKPAFGVSTPWAYKHWRDSQPLPGVQYEVQACPWGEMVNDLERPVFQKHLLLATIKTWLLEQPETAAAMMSGSGSTMFAVLKDNADSAALTDRARALLGTECWIQTAHTL